MDNAGHTFYLRRYLVAMLHLLERGFYRNETMAFQLRLILVQLGASPQLMNEIVINATMRERLRVKVTLSLEEFMEKNWTEEQKKSYKRVRGHWLPSLRYQVVEGKIESQFLKSLKKEPEQGELIANLAFLMGIPHYVPSIERLIEYYRHYYYVHRCRNDHPRYHEVSFMEAAHYGHIEVIEDLLRRQIWEVMGCAGPLPEMERSVNQAFLRAAQVEQIGVMTLLVNSSYLIKDTIIMDALRRASELCKGRVIIFILKEFDPKIDDNLGSKLIVSSFQSGDERLFEFLMKFVQKHRLRFGPNDFNRLLVKYPKRHNFIRIFYPLRLR